MGLYVGIDLHSTNNVTAILDKELQPVLCQRLPNRLEAVLATLRPHRGQIEGIAVESTYNWYWLVDGLMDEGYRAHLTNTSAVRCYEGLKYLDDSHDARWLARLLALGILPTGYIYPKQDRPLRDLLRRRSFLVRQRTANLVSVKNSWARNTGVRVPANELKRWTAEEVEEKIEDPRLALQFSSSLAVMATLKTQIRRIEKLALTYAKPLAPFNLLKTMRGVGDTLALTVMCEVGDIGRFPAVGNYASYCRCVDSKWMSNGKRKGSGNARNGNPYLSWAYTEAAHGAIRYEPLAQRYYNRKSAKAHPMVAIRAVANKLARASYYMLRDRVPFQPERAFG